MFVIMHWKLFLGINKNSQKWYFAHMNGKITSILDIWKDKGEMKEIIESGKIKWKIHVLVTMKTVTWSKLQRQFELWMHNSLKLNLNHTVFMRCKVARPLGNFFVLFSRQKWRNKTEQKINTVSYMNFSSKQLIEYFKYFLISNLQANA